MRLTDVPRLDRTLELAARRVVEGLHAGRHRSPATGSSPEFSDHRAYLPGDDLRAVDWKVAARRDQLLVRRFREERDLPLVLLLDCSASMAWREGGRATKRDWAALAAATLAVHACAQGDRVRIAGGDSRLLAAAGQTAWPAVLSGPAGAAGAVALLDRLPAGGPGDPASLLAETGSRLRRRSLLVLLSDLLCRPESLAQPLGALAARGHELAVVQVLDPAELALPADWGLVHLDDPEGWVPTRTCRADEAKTSYDAAMTTHLEACARVCTGARCDHVLADTSQAVAEVVGRWLHRRSR